MLGDSEDLVLDAVVRLEAFGMGGQVGRKGEVCSHVFGKCPTEVTVNKGGARGCSCS